MASASVRDILEAIAGRGEYRSRVITLRLERINLMSTSKNMRFLITTLGAAVLALAWASPSRAVTWTASGSGGDGALNASAAFTISNGQIQVSITNLLDPATIISIGQSVSDLSFTLSNAPGALGTKTATGQQANVAGGSGGAVTYVSGTPDRWIDSSIGGGVTISGNTVKLEAIGHGQPNQLILPYVVDGGAYPMSNSSIDVHSPNTVGPATFTLSLAGVTDATTITAVEFSFGTGPDTFLDGTESPPGTPEPSTLAIAGLGALGLLGYGLRRRSSK